ncbi:MAG: hypothetical protein Q9197_004118 [Variospora fuerteventurae]
MLVPLESNKGPIHFLIPFYQVGILPQKQQSRYISVLGIHKEIKGINDAGKTISLKADAIVCQGFKDTSGKEPIGNPFSTEGRIVSKDELIMAVYCSDWRELQKYFRERNLPPSPPGALEDFLDKKNVPPSPTS